jgi:integrase/recombinase XerC
MNTEDFITHISAIKKYSHNTIIAYSNDLQSFSNFLESQYLIHDPREVTKPMVRSWIVFLMKSNVEKTSIKRKVSTLSSYFKYLLKQEIIKSSPVSGVVVPKSVQKIPQYISSEKIDLALANTDLSGMSEYNLQMCNAIVELLFATGIRRAELISLKTSDLDFKNKTIKVLGKRNKERIVPLHSKAIEVLQQYSQIRPDSQLDTFFVTEKGNKIYPKLIYNLVTQSLNFVTSQSKKSPHVLRHSFATNMLNEGAEINSIKEILGHSSLAATQVYTHNSIEKLKKQHKQAHPRA